MNEINNHRQVKFNRNKVLFNEIYVKLNSTMSETFGSWLKTLRESRNLNQTELAKRARTTKATISLLESDKIAQPRFDKLEAIAKALGITSQEMRSVYADKSVSPKTETDSHEILNGITITFQNIDLSQNEQEDILNAMRFVARGAMEEFKETKAPNKSGVEREIVDGEERVIIKSPEDLVNFRQEILDKEKGKKKK